MADKEIHIFEADYKIGDTVFYLDDRTVVKARIIVIINATSGILYLTDHKSREIKSYDNIYISSGIPQAAMFKSQAELIESLSKEIDA